MNSPILIPYRDRILGGLWGSLVGDALGVPVEFKDRVAVQNDPVFDLIAKIDPAKAEKSRSEIVSLTDLIDFLIA